MKDQSNKSIVENKQFRLLDESEITAVSGGIGRITTEPLQAEDMYGNKLSPQEYMDFQIALANSHGGDVGPDYGYADPHDFTTWSHW